jgi:hypothetical protein
VSAPKDRLGRVVASVPLNATAAKVVGKGEHYAPRLRADVIDLPSDEPLPTRSVPSDLAAIARELVGQRFGRLTVIGLAAGRSHPARWVARCSCGKFVFRRTKTLRKNLNPDHCCAYCDHLKHIRWRYENHGARDLSDFTGEGR